MICQPCLALGTLDGAWLIVSHKGNAKLTSEPLLIARRRLADEITQLLRIPKTDVRISTIADPSKARQERTTSLGALILISPSSAADDLLELADDEFAQVLSNQTEMMAPIPTGLVFSILD